MIVIYMCLSLAVLYLSPFLVDLVVPTAHRPCSMLQEVQ